MVASSQNFQQNYILQYSSQITTLVGRIYLIHFTTITLQKRTLAQILPIRCHFATQLSSGLIIAIMLQSSEMES